MEKTIELLVSIAEQLDSQGLTVLASRVDSVANNALSIKTAQYVGMQGYAIRNSRCWGNCYRKKRLDSPTKSAQIVWTECHKEYVESINNDGSKWDKYADSQESFVKVASIPQSKYLEIDKQICKVIDEKVASGLDLGNAIFASIDDISNAPHEQIIASSNELLDIATDLVANPVLAEKLAEAANDFTKEAGFFDGIGRAVGNKWQGFQLDRNIGSGIGDMDKSIALVMQSLTNLESSKQKLQKYLTNFKPRTPQQKQSIDNSLQGMFDLKLVSPLAVKRKWESVKQTINLGMQSSPQQQAPQQQQQAHQQTPQQMPSNVSGPMGGWSAPTFASNKVEIKLADVEEYYSGFNPKTKSVFEEKGPVSPVFNPKTKSVFEEKVEQEINSIKKKQTPLPTSGVVQNEVNSIDPVNFEKVYRAIKSNKKVKNLSDETIGYLESLDDNQFLQIKEWQKRRWDASKRTK